MSKLHDLFPTADELLALTPEALAPILLKVAAGARQGMGMFWPESLTMATFGSGMTAERQHVYPYHKKQRVEHLVAEALEVLRREGLILSAPSTNGQHGWMMLSSAGETALATPDGFDRIKAARSFPKTLLHPSIADAVYAALQRGDLTTAVREAITEVEIAVRAAGGFTDDDIGVKMMRQAFDKNDGPLTDKALPEGEREGFAHLFAGAIGAFKNPHSHRKVVITDVRDAQRQVLFASHLLYIIDDRKAAAAAAKKPAA